MLNIVQPNICFIGSSNLSLALIGGLVLKGFQREKINLIEEVKFENQIILKQKQGEFKHEVRQFEKSYDNQQAEQISLMV